MFETQVGAQCFGHATRNLSHNQQQKHPHVNLDFSTRRMRSLTGVLEWWGADDCAHIAQQNGFLTHTFGVNSFVEATAHKAGNLLPHLQFIEESTSLHKALDECNFGATLMSTMHWVAYLPLAPDEWIRINSSKSSGRHTTGPMHRQTMLADITATLVELKKQRVKQHRAEEGKKEDPFWDPDALDVAFVTFNAPAEPINMNADEQREWAEAIQGALVADLEKEEKEEEEQRKAMFCLAISLCSRGVSSW